MQQVPQHHPIEPDLTREESAFLALYQSELPRWENANVLFSALLRSILARAVDVDVSKIEGRVKDRDECLRKFSRKYRAALEESGLAYAIQDYITDLIGVRVVCLYEDELEKVAQIVRSHFDVMDVTDKVTAVESTEASFGYKGLHLDLRLNAAQAALPENAPYAAQTFELQVRTIVQDSWSVLDHKIKYKKAIPAELKRRINVLSALFELADREFRQIRDATHAELLGAPDETTANGHDAPDLAAAALAPVANSALNAFTFLKIATHFFKEAEFEPQKVEAFIDDIEAWSPTITRARFNALMRAGIGVVKRYKLFYEEHHPGSSFNAFTVMRHCLYLGDKTAFHRALRNSSREAFDAWLETQRPAPSSPAPANDIT